MARHEAASVREPRDNGSGQKRQTFGVHGFEHRREDVDVVVANLVVSRSRPWLGLVRHVLVAGGGRVSGLRIGDNAIFWRRDGRPFETCLSDFSMPPPPTD